MDMDTIKTYCAGKKAVTWDYPFDSETLVYRVMGKIFVLMPAVADPPRLNLKCDPTLAEILRREFPAITPGYHMNKQHWNTVVVDGSLPDAQIYEMIDHSYEQVAKGLKKADREKLKRE
jgi:predicted DNA-binding protein (MmcQ/YjbR family)